MTDSPKGIEVELESCEWTPESAAKAALDEHARLLGESGVVLLPPIPFPDRNAANWPSADWPAQWIDWEKWGGERGALWWQVVELSLGISPMVRSHLDLRAHTLYMTSGTGYDLDHPNPLRRRMEIVRQYRDVLPSMPDLEPVRVGPAVDPYLPGKPDSDWAIEWGRFREFAQDQGWTIPEKFPQGRPFAPTSAAVPAIAPSPTHSESLEKTIPGMELPNLPARWGETDGTRLQRVRDAGLEAWVVGQLRDGVKKAAIVTDLLEKLREPPVPDPLKSPWQRVVQALTPQEVARKERRRGGSGR